MNNTTNKTTSEYLNDMELKQINNYLKNQFEYSNENNNLNDSLYHILH